MESVIQTAVDIISTNSEGDFGEIKWDYSTPTDRRWQVLEIPKLYPLIFVGAVVVIIVTFICCCCFCCIMLCRRKA